MLLISGQQLLGKAKCSVFFRTKSQIDIYPFEGTTTYTRTTSEESIQHINARRLGGSWYGSVYVASDTGLQLPVVPIEKVNASSIGQ